MFDNIKVTTTVEVNNIKIHVDDPTVTTSLCRLLNVLKEHKTDMDIVSNALSDGRIRYDVSGLNEKVYDNIKNMLSAFPQISNGPLEDIFKPMRSLYQSHEPTQSDTKQEIDKKQENTQAPNIQQIDTINNLAFGTISNMLGLYKDKSDTPDDRDTLDQEDSKSVRTTPFD